MVQTNSCAVRDNCVGLFTVYCKMSIDKFQMRGQEQMYIPMEKNNLKYQL